MQANPDLGHRSIECRVIKFTPKGEPFLIHYGNAMFRRSWRNKTTTMFRGLSDIERFNDKVDKKPGGCWVWVGAKTVNGNPNFGVRKNGGGFRFMSARKFSYQHHNGRLPLSHKSYPTCGNRLCVNPKHLIAKAA